MKISIEIDNLKEYHAKAIEAMLATWQYLGAVGSSRNVLFFADGDGDFRPKITVNGKKPEFAKFKTPNGFVEYPWEKPLGLKGMGYEIYYDDLIVGDSQ